MATFRDPPFLKHLPREIAASETLVDSVGIVLDRLVGWKQFFWVGVFRVEESRAKRVDFRGPLPSECRDPESVAAIRTGFVEVKATLAIPIRNESGRLIGTLHVETDETSGFSPEDTRILGLVAQQLGPVLRLRDRPALPRYDL